MAYFVCKLIPPRPTFTSDMSEAEKATMSAHGDYWSDLLARRVAVLFGPVADPAGTWGLAVVESAAEAEVRALAEADPAVTSGVATCAVYPMLFASVRS
jgi:uncharacterized protein YciI